MLGTQCPEQILSIWLHEKTVCLQRGTLTAVSVAQICVRFTTKMASAALIPFSTGYKTQIESKSSQL